MGIDIYLKWNKMSKEEIEAQYTGFSVTSGHVGYLREAYHGEPYATRELVKEAFESKNGEAKISAETLRKRLPSVLKLVEKREKQLYSSNRNTINKVKKSFKDFVELVDKKEKETKRKVTIIASY